MTLICKACQGRVWMLNFGMCDTCYEANPGLRHSGTLNRKPGKWYYDKEDNDWEIFYGSSRGNIQKNIGFRSVYYSSFYLGNFKNLRRAKAWLEEVAPLIDAGEDWKSGPENERGPDWFSNDGIDYREVA